ncbi:MAG: response regulator transcription factor [Rhodobacteraceae bacterium]|jgi:DNA-binding response OmpR family regulator|nr:response regulator transcription factor [Paracoccaceae bacterium]
MQILMVEDEPRVADFVRRGLRAEGWIIDHAGNAEDALIRLRDGVYDVVLLDVMLPGMSGDALCRLLRSGRNDVPILMLSALGSTEDRVNGLRTGADDYLPKPFEFDELIARIEALHRRKTRSAGPEVDRLLRVGPLCFDPASMRLTLQDVDVDLSTKERDVLVLLMRNAGRVCARERLLNAVWGLEADPLTNVVDVTVSRIRRKLPQSADMIATIRNYGYRLDPGPAKPDP